MSSWHLCAAAVRLRRRRDRLARREPRARHRTDARV